MLEFDSNPLSPYVLNVAINTYKLDTTPNLMNLFDENNNHFISSINILCTK